MARVTNAADRMRLRRSLRLSHGPDVPSRGNARRGPLDTLVQRRPVPLLSSPQGDVDVAFLPQPVISGRGVPPAQLAANAGRCIPGELNAACAPNLNVIDPRQQPLPSGGVSRPQGPLT